MATYYVAKTGNDSTGDGSSGSPWKTINKAMKPVSQGGMPDGTAGSPNTLIVKNGNYNMVAGEGISATDQGVDITKNYVIVKAETRKGVVLRGNWTPALLRGAGGYAKPCDCGKDTNGDGCGDGWDASTPYTLPDPANYFGKNAIFDMHGAGATLDGFVIECVACDGIRWSAGNGSTIQYNVTYWTLEQGINALTAAVGNFGNMNLAGSNISLLYNEVYLASTGRFSPAWVCKNQGWNKVRPDAASGALRYGSVVGPGLVKGNIVAYCLGEGYDIGKRCYGTPDNPIIVEDNIAHDNRHVQMYILHGLHVHFRNNKSYCTAGHKVFNLSPKHGGNCYTVRDEQIDELPATTTCFIYNNLAVNSDTLMNVGNNPEGTAVPKTNIYIGFNTFVSGGYTDSAIRLGSNNTGIFENNVIHHENAPAAAGMDVSGGNFTVRKNAWSKAPKANGRFVVGGNIIGNAPGVNQPNLGLVGAMVDLTTTGFDFYSTYAEFAAAVSDNFNPENYYINNSSPVKDAAGAKQAAGGTNPPNTPFQVDGTGAARVVPDMGWYEAGGVQTPIFEAAFSANPAALSLVTGTAVAFTNQSNYANTELVGYLWTVKKAGVTQQTATTTNLNYTFGSAGSWTVSLKITTADGNDTETVTYTITDPVAVVNAAFSRSPAALSVVQGTTITFTDQSTFENCVFSSRLWEVKNAGGSVIASSAASPYGYLFNTVGTFTVKLTENGTGGASDTAQVTITVTVLAAQVTAAMSHVPAGNTIDRGTQVTFTDASVITGGSFLSRLWEVKNAAGAVLATSTASPYAYTFATAGVFTVKLTETATGPVSDTVEETITVREPAARVVAAMSREPAANSILTGQSVVFTDQSTIENATFVSRLWEVLDSLGAVVASSAANPYSYTFAVAGTFTVRLTETATGGASDSVQVSITVTDPVVASVTADFTASDPDLVIVAGNGITFTNTSAAINCSITGYTWSVLRQGGGGEETFATTNLSYTFRQAGTWIVSLRVDTDAGLVDAHFVTVTVQESQGAGGTTDFMVAAVQFAAATSTGTQTITATALGSLVPKGVHFKLAGGTVAGTVVNDALWGEGAAGTSGQWTFARFSQNGQAAAVAKKRKSSAACLMTIDAAGAVTGLADFIQFVAGGVEINVSDAFPAGFLGEAVFFAGDAAEFWCGGGLAGAAGSEVTITTGIDQDAVYLASPWASTDDAENDAEYSRGWALKTGEQMSFRHEDRHGKDPTESFVRHHATRVGSSADGTPGTYVGIEAAAFTATSFNVKVTTNSLNRAWFAYSFASGGKRLQLTTETLSTGASSAHAIGFEAQTVMALLSTMTATETQLGGTAADGRMAGWYCKSVHDGYEGSYSIAAASNAATSATRSLAAAGFRAVNSDGTNVFNGTTALDADSLDITWSTAPASGYKMILLAVEVGVTVEEPVEDEPVADFTASVQAGTGRTVVDFDSSTSNGNGNPITGYLWDFGDGDTSTEANPRHIYEYPGDYDVSLTVTTAAGSNTKTVAAFVRIAAVGAVEYLIGGIVAQGVTSQSDNSVDEDGNVTMKGRFDWLWIRAMTAEQVAEFVAQDADPEYALVVYDAANHQFVVKESDGTHRKVTTAAYP